MKKTLLAALLAVSTLAPVAAYAEDAYVKLGIGRSEYKDAFGDGFSPKGTGATLGIGVNLDKTWAMELGYVNFGKDSQTYTEGLNTAKVSIKAQSIYLAAIGKVPVSEGFAFFGKGGIAVTKIDATITNSIPPNFSGSETKAGFLVGAGAAYQITKEVAATLDYTYFINPSSIDNRLSLLTLGLNYGY